MQSNDYFQKFQNNIEVTYCASKKWITQEVPVYCKWLGHKVVLIKNLLQYSVVAYPVVIAINILFFQVAELFSKKIYHLFPKPENLENHLRWVKNLSVLTTFLSTYVLSNIGFIKIFRPAVHPFFYAALSTSTLVFKSYLKISKTL